MTTQHSDRQYRPIKRKRGNTLVAPKLECGPGPNCKASSKASVDVISTILESVCGAKCQEDVAKALRLSIAPNMLEK